MSVTLRPKLPNTGTSIFTTISQLARETGALNLGQGFPDFNPPEVFEEAMGRHIRAGQNQYAPSPGVPRLRQQIAAKLQRSYGCQLDPDSEVTVTDGATEGLFDSVTAVVHVGDEAIVLDPCYDAYVPNVQLSGGRVTRLPLQDDFGIDYERLQQALSNNPRLLFLNFPHNPSGAVLTAEDLRKLETLLRPTNTVVISDEVYEHIVFDGRRPISILCSAELRERSFVVGSFGKAYHTTGWKVGWVAAPPALSAELRRVHQFVSFSTSTAAQHTFADLLEHHPELLTELPQFYQRKRDTFRALLQDSQLKLLPTAATYFQLADYSAISQLPDTELAHRLLVEAGVASIPLSPFCAPGNRRQLIRFCFAKSDALLEQACQRLCSLRPGDLT